MVGGLQKHKVPLTPPSYGLLFVFLKATLHTHRLIIVGPQPFHIFALLLVLYCQQLKWRCFLQRGDNTSSILFTEMKTTRGSEVAVARLYLRVGFSTWSSSTCPCFAVWVIKDQARALLLAADNCTLHSTYTGALLTNSLLYQNQTRLPVKRSHYPQSDKH